MLVEQKKWLKEKGWSSPVGFHGKSPQLVLAFGDRLLLNDPQRFEELKTFYPHAQIILASTAGNIMSNTVDEHSIVATAITFEKPVKILIKRTNIADSENSFRAGLFLGNELPKAGLKHVFLLSDGHLVNGTALIRGALTTLPETIAITGGLAGDGNRFQKTVVGFNQSPREGEIVAVGFYGDHLQFGFGSVGGWDPFGIERKITRSQGNILYELDNKSALDLYKNYLGDQAEELPSAALLFPLAIRQNKESPPLVRTILRIDEKEKAMIFAGDVPEGWYAQLMKANFDRLIDGAFQAASLSCDMLQKQPPELAILISCVGRRLVLGPRIEEEIEAASDHFGRDAAITGFYAYGEMAPPSSHTPCELHNQSMTITTVREI